MSRKQRKRTIAEKQAICDLYYCALSVIEQLEQEYDLYKELRNAERRAKRRAVTQAIEEVTSTTPQQRKEPMRPR